MHQPWQGSIRKPILTLLLDNAPVAERFKQGTCRTFRSSNLCGGELPGNFATLLHACILQGRLGTASGVNYNEREGVRKEDKPCQKRFA
jgi:hypothetical protein